MSFFDILHLALRNPRQAKLRALLTTMGVVVGVAVIVTMVSFGLGLQRNMLARFRALDLFNEIQVFGRGLSTLAGLDRSGRDEGDRGGGRRQRTDKNPTRILDDQGISELAAIPGVAYVEPNVSFSTYVRSNGKVLNQNVGGANIPNARTRFHQFAAGTMTSSPQANEAGVTGRLARDFGYEEPAEAIGKTLELLAPVDEKANEKKAKEEEEETPNFFGIPLDDDGLDESNSSGLDTRSFVISGVLATEIREGAGQGGLRGLMPGAGVYLPLGTAHAWNLKHRGPMSRVALALARTGGKLNEGQTEGYDSAIVRVHDPVALTEVRKKITELGFSSFSIVDELDQIRTVFLIIDAVLGLLGGISLLVASFGIANTMIMSILERTREIGIMKAIGAEDREIRMIFFVEA